MAAMSRNRQSEETPLQRLWLVVSLSLVVAMTLGACLGTRAVLEPEEVTVYEEFCYDRYDRQTQCRPLDVPRTETQYPAGADVWAGIFAFIFGWGLVARLDKVVEPALRSKEARRS